MTKKERERLSKQLATEIRKTRIAAGFTQSELAKKIGTSQPTVARIESGRHYCITLRTLSRIVAACGKKILISMK